jgi:hypothetical protein
VASSVNALRQDASELIKVAASASGRDKVKRLIKKAVTRKLGKALRMTAKARRQRRLSEDCAALLESRIRSEQARANCLIPKGRASGSQQ